MRLERPPVRLDAASATALPDALERGADADDVGAGRGERLGHRQADAAPGAGDDGEPAGQVEAVDGGSRVGLTVAAVDQHLHHVAAGLQRLERRPRVGRAARSG